MRVLLVGASGFVGGRLLGPLLEAGHSVRCLTRQPRRLAGRLASGATLAVGDLLDPPSLRAALSDVDAAFYLAHALGSGGDFEREEARGAEAFAAAARAAGLPRIVYLGALARDPGGSRHLESRQAVGERLRASGAAVTELRSSIILGAGSLPFEVVRGLVEKLPLLITPRWVRLPLQPIAARDVVTYLVRALTLLAGARADRAYEIGGAEVASFDALMRSYARVRGLRRAWAPVPVVTPRLSALWLSLFTPAHARAARRIVESVGGRSVVADDTAERLLSVRPLGLEAAIRAALAEEREALWEPAGPEAPPGDAAERRWSGRRGQWFVERRQRDVDASPQAVFDALERLGGADGWGRADWLWRLRGALDRAIGGPGMRRAPGRARTALGPGDELDFWRVEALDPGARLRLRAEMRLPGEAWLELAVGKGPRGARVSQTALFDPRGLLGLAYWYALLPLHRAVFAALLREIARRARHSEVARPERDGSAGAASADKD
jgi:uncharacterized protein YbjT (DUF2867 family)